MTTTPLTMAEYAEYAEAVAGGDTICQCGATCTRTRSRCSSVRPRRWGSRMRRWGRWCAAATTLISRRMRRG